MIHPHTKLEFISPEIGYGVVATQLIPKGTITWIFDSFDQVFSPDQLTAMDVIHKKIMDTYSYRDHDGQHILCWDHARFVNHSFNSSCVSTAYNFELAVRDILPGEQLTDDYGYLNVSEPFKCLPEEGSTRTMVYPDDLIYFHDYWDELLIDSFKSFHDIHQPLFSLIDPMYRRKVLEVASGRSGMDSILNCYYPGDTMRIGSTG